MVQVAITIIVKVIIMIIIIFNGHTLIEYKRREDQDSFHFILLNLKLAVTLLQNPIALSFKITPSSYLIYRAEAEAQPNSTKNLS